MKSRKQQQKQNTINTNAVGEQFRTCIERSNRWIRTEKSLETESEKIRLKITMTMTTTEATTTTTLTRSERSERNESKKEWNTVKKRTYTALHCVRYVCEWVTDWLADWMVEKRERVRDGEREREARRRRRGRDILTRIWIHAYLYIHSISRTSAELTMNLFSFYVFKTYTHRPSGFITHWNNFVCKLSEKQQE